MLLQGYYGLVLKPHFLSFPFLIFVVTVFVFHNIKMFPGVSTFQRRVKYATCMALLSTIFFISMLIVFKEGVIPYPFLSETYQVLALVLLTDFISNFFIIFQFPPEDPLLVQSFLTFCLHTSHFFLSFVFFSSSFLSLFSRWHEASCLHPLITLAYPHCSQGQSYPLFMRAEV